MVYTSEELSVGGESAVHFVPGFCEETLGEFTLKHKHGTSVRGRGGGICKTVCFYACERTCVNVCMCVHVRASYLKKGR